MQPIVDGLESEYNTEIEFRFIDANSATGNPIYKSFQLRGHPSYVMLNPNGETVWTGLGVQTQAQMQTQFEAALAPP
ncbi:MAG: hypothetical protein DWQ07_18555 [Chloroflexi bacterium]|nr:MAG: hypothetical protein DWQ07_18555 [Chloroflexota bacterium]MBL1194933.1 hypothetical protein [Chloroflexota bacterium]NOH12223.1 hypothetical protein [Chloroflexota bacterium]